MKELNVDGVMSRSSERSSIWLNRPTVGRLRWMCDGVKGMYATRSERVTTTELLQKKVSNSDEAVDVPDLETEDRLGRNDYN